MAIAIVGTANSDGNKTSETANSVLRYGGNGSIGDLAVLCIACDNAGASGASSLGSVPTDAAGNTFSLVKVQNRTAGSAANDGCTVAIYKCVLTNAVVANTTTITINWSPATLAKAFEVIIFSGANGAQTSTDGNGGSGATYTSNASASLATGDLIVGACANESATSPVGDSDTTNGSWVHPVNPGPSSAGSGGDGTKMALMVSYKIVTGSGTQTFNGATGASTDWAVATANWTISDPYTQPIPQVITNPYAASRASRW